MALQYLFDPNKQFQSIGGVNEVGGFLRVYLNGTDDRAVTYRNFDGGLNEPDIVLDTYGRSVVIVDDTKKYRLEVYNRLGGLMWTISNYKAQGGSGGGSGAQVVVEGTIGEIDVYENTVGGIKYFIASLSSVVKNAIDSLTSAVNGLVVSLGSKKELQIPKSFSGSTTKTPTSITQNENGEMDVNFEDIEFPDYSQRFEKIENEQTVDAKVIAAALNDLNARLDALESEGDNIGDVTADSLNAQNLFVGGVKVKFQQAVKYFDGATNKTVTNISQNENGEITVTYSPIAFPDWTSAINAATDLCEKLANKKTTFSGFETSDTFYPTLKAVVEYLDGRLQNIGGKKITNNGQPFTSDSQLPSSTPYYGQNINTDDYAFVQDTGLASRYTAIVSGSSVSWSLDYEISMPVFTAEQQAAIDSGVNSTKVGNYDAHIANTSNPHGVTYSQVGASPDTHTHQVVINGVTKTIPATGGSPVDLGSYLTSHQDLSNYLTKNGDGSDVTASFTAAGSRNNISTGEILSVIFGKIAKWFSDLKALAFKDKVSDSDISGTIADAHIASASVWNAKQNALPTTGTPSNTFAINISGNAASTDIANVANTLPYGRAAWNGPAQKGDKKVVCINPTELNYNDVMVTLDIYETVAAVGDMFRGKLMIDLRRNSDSTYAYNASYVGKPFRYTTMYVKYDTNSHSVYVIFNKNNDNYVGIKAVVASAQGYQGISAMSNVTLYNNLDIETTTQYTNISITYNYICSVQSAIGSSSTPIYVDEYGIPKPCGTIGFANSAKQLSDYRGTEGQDGYKNIYGGYNSGTGEFGLGISKRESGYTKSSEVNADGMTTTEYIIAAKGFIGPTFSGLANQAVSDSDGNPINTTYAKKISGIYNIDTYLTDGNAFHDVNLRKQLGPRYVHTRGFTPLMMFYGIINFVDIEYADGYNYAAVDFELYNTQQSGTYGTLMASIGMVVPKGTSSIVIPLPFAWNSGSFSPTLYGNFAHRITAGSAVCNAYYYSLPV